MTAKARPRGLLRPLRPRHSDLNLDDGTNPHGTTASDVGAFSDESQIDHDALTNFVAAEHRTHPTSTDNAIARYDGTSGDLQDSSVTLDDSNVMSGVTRLNVDNLRLDGNTLSSQTGTLNLTTPTGVTALNLSPGGVNVLSVISSLVATNVNTNIGGTLDVAGEVVAHREDAGTNTKLDLLTLRRTTTGTAAAELGLNVLLELEDASGNTDVAGKLVCDWSDATHGSEDSVIELFNVRAGTLEDAFRFSSTAMQVRFGRRLEVYDSDNSDYVEIAHNGTDGYIREVTGGSLFIGGSSAAASVIEADPNGGFGSGPLTSFRGDVRAEQLGGGTFDIDGGDFSVDDDTLYVDDSGHFVGIGTTAPNSQLELVSEANVASRHLSATMYFSSPAGANMQFRKARNTEASPSAVSDGDAIGVFQGRPYDGSDFIPAARFGFEVNGTVATGSVPTDIVFYPGASSFGTERLRVTSGGALQISDGITAPATRTGFASVYVDASDGDLKIKYGDGTVKTIVTDT